MTYIIKCKHGDREGWTRINKIYNYNVRAMILACCVCESGTLHVWECAWDYMRECAWNHKCLRRRDHVSTRPFVRETTCARDVETTHPWDHVSVRPQFCKVLKFWPHLHLSISKLLKVPSWWESIKILVSIVTESTIKKRWRI